MPSAEVRRHWQRVFDIGCVICGQYPTLHHCHGGSMTQIIGIKGVAMKSNDWLVIPLAPRYHTGCYGIDAGYGVESWERDFGEQAMHLDTVCQLLGYNVWRRAGIDREVLLDGEPI